MRYTAWFWRYPAGAGQTIFSRRSISKPVIHSIHFLADFYPGHTLAQRGYHSGKFVTGNGAKAFRTAFGMSGGVPKKFCRYHTSSVHLD